MQRAVTTVEVQAPVDWLDVECDPVFATYEEGSCVATLWEGTDASFTADVTSSPAVHHSFTAIAGRSRGLVCALTTRGGGGGDGGRKGRGWSVA